jgi:hypothetical protein
MKKNVHPSRKGADPPQQWMAQHEDMHFDSFNKLCFALNHDIDEHFSRANLSGKEPLNIQMYYPILILSGNLIEVFPTEGELVIRPTEHIHYIQSYITIGREKRYHIDVVTEEYLPKLLGLIRRELLKTVRLLRHHGTEVRASSDKITASVEGLNSPEAIRAAMEP